ncbi:MAG: type I-B CRISPR-associated protein Cas7/Cst2/DevR, partial [Pyrinomonadaceae bacterium]
MKTMSKNILGLVLIDAPHSALNNDQADPSAADENESPTKKIKKGFETIPYVSAQAWRYWWRNTLENKFDWEMSPIIREKKIAFTSANPFTYPDDDVFGYMRALKKDDGGTLTRLSPLKTSPLISVVSQRLTSDFGVMSRHEGDPVPHVHEFYSTVLKGIFSLDISSVGIFQSTARTGYKNLDEAYTEKPEIKQSIENAQAEQQNGNWMLPKEMRVKRAKETIEALPFLSGGAKSALHLTDVTPKFIVLAVIDGGNHLFMNVTAERIDEPLIKTSALKEVITDYKDSILSDIYIGRQEGFHDE